MLQRLMEERFQGLHIYFFKILTQNNFTLILISLVQNKIPTY